MRRLTSQSVKTNQCFKNQTLVQKQEQNWFQATDLFTSGGSSPGIVTGSLKFSIFHSTSPLLTEWLNPFGPPPRFFLSRLWFLNSLHSVFPKLKKPFGASGRPSTGYQSVPWKICKTGQTCSHLFVLARTSAAAAAFNKPTHLNHPPQPKE